MSELMHIGVKNRSGRYKHGSGENPHQHCGEFLGVEKTLRKEGLSEKEIADYFGLTIRELRAKKSNALNENYAANRAMAMRLKAKGYSQVAIAERMGVGESVVRSWLKEDRVKRSGIAKNTADLLEKDVNERSYIDVGKGVENQLNVTRTSLNNSLQMLKDKGYKVYYVQTEQLGTGKKTTIQVLAKPDSTYSEVFKNREHISIPGFYYDSETSTHVGIKPPKSVSSKRLKVRYAEEGGVDKDGVIELRRGVEDISLGNARYAQVRIAVDGTHYLKGMAMYSDNMPDGVDIIFNTNKKKGTPALGPKDNTVLKPMKDDADNPFGATIRQKTYFDKNGKEQLSAINIVNEEGDWSTWRKTLSSQMLSKQTPTLAKRQLGLAYDLKKEEFDEIMKLENPVIRQALLDKFADGCDSASVHLKAAGLPRQASKVILPFPDMKESEIYAPGFRDGESVALIRYPHAGTFEIPVLKVNNRRNKTADSVIHNAKDAVGINSKVAEQLSGADFDGDTVLVIPMAGAKIKASSPLKGLADFDPKTAYPAYPGMIKTGEKGSGFDKQREMGNVSNLITDMTIKGATPDEIARAVRHSMVVIDAEKHNLNYKQSFLDNDIAALKTKYQGGPKSGASTLISRSSSVARPYTRKEIKNPKDMTPDEIRRYNNGERIFRETEEYYTNKHGKEVRRTIKSTKMAEAKDAHDLSTGSTMEVIYADHANKLKDLANKARKESRNTRPIPYSPEAKKLYSNEVETLNSKLNIALKNKPLERKAQLLAGAKVRIVKQANPDMDADDISKLKGRALSEARLKVGANKKQVQITDKEWEAIQAGAISTNKLKEIIDNSDIDILKQLAMPREYKGLSPAKQSRAKSMAARGYTLAEIADALGVSTSTVQKALD